MSKFLFCEKCQKVVSEKDTKEMVFKITPEFIEKFCKSNPDMVPGEKKSVHHYLSEMVNAYDNGFPPDPKSRRVGFLPETKTTLCGKVRELTDQEYFIYYTCGEIKND